MCVPSSSVARVLHGSCSHACPGTRAPPWIDGSRRLADGRGRDCVVVRNHTCPVDQSGLGAARTQTIVILLRRILSSPLKGYRIARSLHGAMLIGTPSHVMCGVEISGHARERIGARCVRADDLGVGRENRYERRGRVRPHGVRRRLRARTRICGHCVRQWHELRRLREQALEHRVLRLHELTKKRYLTLQLLLSGHRRPLPEDTTSSFE